jgi:anaerobic dimethyl sulfoxide reductase subunit A
MASEGPSEEHYPLTEHWLPFTCTLDCGSRCALLGQIVDGKLARIDTPPGPDSNALPRLIPCARGRAQRRWLTAANRVGAPLLRHHGELKRASWSTALDYAASELERVRAAYGAPAILLATGAGSGGGRGFSGAGAARRLFSYWASVTETSGNLSHHCATWVEQNMLGTEVAANDRATLLDSSLILLWGNNPADTHMGPNTEHFIRQARDRGALTVLIDPRLSDSGALADVWLPVRPGTDVALVAALAYLLESWGAVDCAFLGTHTAGYELYRRYVQGSDDGAPKTAAWASGITGLPEERLIWLAQQLAERRPVAILPGWGPQRAQWGEQFHRAMITLACVTGNVGRSGGGLPGVGVRLGGFDLPRLPFGELRAARTIHAGSWARALLDETLDPSVRLAFVSASNLVNRSSDTNASIRALRGLETVIVLDPFLTPTGRLADVVLPINTDPERADVVASWGYDLHLFDSQRLADTPDEARSDYWVCAELARRLGVGAQYTQGKTEAEWLAEWRAQPTPDLAALDGAGVLRRDPPPRVALAEFRADPAAHPLPTPSGRIEIASEAATRRGLPAIPAYLAPEPGDEDRGYPLHLLTPHHKLRANSGHAGNPWLTAIDEQALWLNATDAVARGIADGEQVEVYNGRGRARVRAHVTQRIMPGVVCLPQGAWLELDDGGVDRAGSANVLTRLAITPTGGPTTHTSWVEVRRVDA